MADFQTPVLHVAYDVNTVERGDFLLVTGRGYSCNIADNRDGKWILTITVVSDPDYHEEVSYDSVWPALTDARRLCKYPNESGV